VKHPFVFQRVCAWSMLACLLSFFGAFILAGFIPPLSPNASAVTIAHHYQQHTTGIRLGGCLMLLSGMFYAAFTGVISAQMRRIPGLHSAAVYTQLAAGAFACLTFLVPAMLFIVTAFRPYRDPATTQTLNDMSWIFLVIPWPPFMVQYFTLAYAVLTDRRENPLFPRWLGYMNIWGPVVFTPGLLLSFFKTGPFSWRGLLVFWVPGAAFGAMLLANMVMVLRAIRDEQDGLSADGRAGAPGAEQLALATS
jgi:hypothetical protein